MPDAGTDILVGAAQLLPERLIPSGPQTLVEARRKGRNIVKEAKLIKSITDIELRRCRAKAKVRDADGQPVLDENGKPQRRQCRAWAIKGGSVCVKHGGQAPAVRDRANKRLLAMVEPSLIELNELVHQNEHLPTKLGAIRTVLERAAGNALGALKTEVEKDSRPIIQIGIAVGGITQSEPKVAVNLIPAARSDVAEGEVADKDTDDVSAD